MKVQHLVAGMLLVIIAVAFFHLNQQVPRFADDLCRLSPSFDPANILAQVGDDYVNWTGRLPVMLTNRVLFSLGDVGLDIFNCINALMLIAASGLVLRLARPRALLPTIFLLSSFAALFWFVPHRFGEVALWKSGAIQYFWGSVIALYALAPALRYYFWREQPPAGVSPTAVYCIIAFIGGAWLENLSAALGVTFLLGLLVSWRFQALPPRPLLAGFISWIAGLALLLSAPGNYKRADGIGYIASVPERIIIACQHCVEYFNTFLLLAYAIAIALILIERPNDLGRRVKTSAAIVGIACLSIITTAAAPTATFVGRVAFPFEFLMLVGALVLLPPFESPLMRRGRLFMGFATSLVLAALIARYLDIVTMYTAVARQSDERDKIIRLAKQNHERGPIALPGLSFDEDRNTRHGTINEGHLFARDITSNPLHWRNQCYARAYGIHSVKLESPAD